jgi:hypothetical protein
MAAITSLTVTLSGRVNSRVVKLFANGTEIVLAANKTWSHALTVTPGTRSLSMTTYDSSGLAETRAVLLEAVATPVSFA